MKAGILMGWGEGHLSEGRKSHGQYSGKADSAASKLLSFAQLWPGPLPSTPACSVLEAQGSHL